MSDTNAETLTDAVLRLAKSSGGRPFPDTAVADIGGWTRIAADAQTLAGHPTLPLVAILVARDAEPGDASAAAAAVAVADAVLATGQPALLRDSLEALLTSAVAVHVAGDKLAAGLEPVAAAFLARDDREPKADLASADALEALTQLVAAGHGSHFALLTLAAEVHHPDGGADVASGHAVGLDRVGHLAEADPLIGVVRALGGVDPVDGGDADLAADVESDASWILAMASLLRALRAPSVQDMDPHLVDAARYFTVAATTHGRPDAAPMASVIKALRELIAGVLASDPMSAMRTEPLSADAVEGHPEPDSSVRHRLQRPRPLVRRQQARNADRVGGAHRRPRTNGRPARQGRFLPAEVVVGDLLNVYVSSRTFRVGTRGAAALGVEDLVQPVIETGFASNASHLANLEEFTADLETRESPSLEDTESFSAARTLVEAARRVAKGDDASGKSDGGVPSTPLPPRLGSLVPPGSPEAALLDQFSPTILASIEEGLDHVANARSHLNLVQQELLDNLRTALAKSPDYNKGEVVAAVDEMLLLIINFVASRTDSSAGHYGYLFDPTSNEDAIHEDLYGYLVGNLGTDVQYEVSHIGGGRIDIRVKYHAFAMHVEMKVDHTKMPMSDRTAYLKQAATYQGNDIRIGFLVALRHKAFDPTGPPPHITALIGHTAFNIDGDPEPRHIITVALPGSRINPSASK